MVERFAVPILRDKPVAAIDTPDVLSCLEPIWRTKTKTAGELRFTLEAMLGYAMAKGYRPRGPNPASWEYLKDALTAPGILRQNREIAGEELHHKAMDSRELPSFLVELRTWKWSKRAM